MAHLKVYTADGKYGLYVFDDGDTDPLNWLDRLKNAIDDEFSVRLKAAENGARVLVAGRHITSVFLAEDEVPWPVEEATRSHTMKAQDVHHYHPTTWVCTKCDRAAEFTWEKWDKSAVTGSAAHSDCPGF